MHRPAFATHGVCAGLYEETLMRGRVVVSDFILQELRTKLLSKALLSASETGEIISAVEADSDVVDVKPLEVPVCRDADDDWILATALAGQADALATGDKDLLVLKFFKGIPILQPREALVLIRKA